MCADHVRDTRETARGFCIWFRKEGRHLGVDDDGVYGLISDNDTIAVVRRRWD
jgi:hypothetical protein